ncbi:MAG: AAA family ATPase [Helicobacter sp.]|nr:AAA family ATPase [Helicobacter sp.]
MIILGENNVGKSNLLAALAKFGSDSPSLQGDEPNFVEYENCLPKIELSHKVLKSKAESNFSSKVQVNDDFLKQKYNNSLMGKTFHIPFYPDSYIKQKTAPKDKNGFPLQSQRTNSDYQKHIEHIQKLFNTAQQIYGEYSDKDGKKCIKLIIKADNPQYDHLLLCELNTLKCFFEHQQPHAKFYQSKKLSCKFIFADNSRSDNVKELVEFFNPSNMENSDMINNHLIDSKENKMIAADNDSYCYNKASIYLDGENKTITNDSKIPIPKVTLYKESFLNNNSLCSTSNEIGNSVFFESLFKAIGYDKLKLQDAYDNFKKNTKRTRRYYKIEEENINEKLNIINNRFNKFYGKNNELYSFKIILEADNIQIEISNNGQVIYLDEQSVGFRKFFNFFFNFLYMCEADEGNIVLIDEAETHLSIPAQRDLRKLLKEFGQKHGILFVITTHSPFMLDMNHLDEIRILKTKEDGIGVKIINEFSFVADTAVDTLGEIKSALGVDYYHLINPESKPIFVEGITDYNYLVALVKCYNEEHKDKPINLTFLPIGGLGEEGQQQIEKMESLIKFSNKLRISPAILLVDNDGAGRAIKKLAGEEKYRDNLQVILLNECEKLSKFPQDVEIEDLFSEKDREKFGISKEKNSQAAADFKNTKDLAAQLDEETKDNFYALLKYLENIASPRTIKHNPSSLFARNLAILH